MNVSHEFPDICHDVSRNDVSQKIIIQHSTNDERRVQFVLSIIIGFVIKSIIKIEFVQKFHFPDGKNAFFDGVFEP